MRHGPLESVLHCIALRQSHVNAMQMSMTRKKGWIYILNSCGLLSGINFLLNIFKQRID